MSNTVFLIVAAVVLLFVALAYNSLVRRRNQIDFAASSTDALLKKRHDLIPNLVETVRGYMQHERGLLERITELRSQARAHALSSPQRIEAESGLAAALATVFARVEAYPQLRASENMLHLQATLNEIEEQISAARRFFNSAVADYNNAVDSFPSNFIASMFRFERRQYFELPDIERTAPIVSLRDSTSAPSVPGATHTQSLPGGPPASGTPPAPGGPTAPPAAPAP